MKKPAVCGGGLEGKAKAETNKSPADLQAADCCFYCPKPVCHSGCPLCLPMCSKHRAEYRCLICSDWRWIEPRKLLPVRRELMRNEWHGFGATIFLSLSFGWRDDHEQPYINADVPLDFALDLPWAGQA